jgi:acetylglutamate kinase
VLKLGGELLETAEGRARIAAAVAAIVKTRAVIVIHGGGRAIDAELDRRGIAPKKVDGLRVTDAPTLDAVIAVLAGSANTELVAACVAAGVPAVGLTGVDAGFGRAQRVRAHRTAAGATVDLGLVGDPAEVDAHLLDVLLAGGFVPVVASLGLDVDTGHRSTVLNVNADVMACRIAAGLNDADVDLVIAGATAGVFDANGQTIAQLDSEAIDAMIADGSASAGMIAKLNACREALRGGAGSVRIVDGRAIDASRGVTDAPGTTIVVTR